MTRSPAVCVISKITHMTQNMGLSKGNNYLETKSRTMSMFSHLEDDWITLPPDTTKYAPNLAQFSLNFLDVHRDVLRYFW